MPVPGNGGMTGAGRCRSAPVCVWFLSVCVLLLGNSTTAAECRSDRIDETVRVSHVSDGDSLILGDGRRLRIIGVNSPEMGRDGNPPDAGALAARERLRQWVFGNRQQLQLRFDQEREDRYGRLLAHAFLHDGSNLSERLLAEGHAYHLVVPPNTWQVDCYRAAQEQARRAGRGLWSLPEHAIRRVQDLTLRSSGFMRIQGHVSHLGESARAVWINLAGDAALRLDREDLAHFPAGLLERLVGSEVEAQGWLYVQNGQPRMQLRHPASLYLLERRLPSPPASQ